MNSIFYELSGSIGDSLEKLNTNFLNLDLLIGNTDLQDSFAYRSKYIELIYNIYVKYKSLFTTLIEKNDEIDNFCTLVEANSAKWLQPYVFFYPFVENSKGYLNSSQSQSQLISSIINWVNVAYPLQINIQDCEASSQYVQGQTAYVQFALNVENTNIDSPSPDVTTDSGYCTTQEYETCISCQRIYHGYTFCGTGSVFNCEGASIDFTSCGTVKCSFEGPYEKIKVLAPGAGASGVNTKSETIEQIKSSVTSKIQAIYENKKEYLFIQTIKIKVENCQWVYEDILPDVSFEKISEGFHWCEEHQTYDNCYIDPEIIKLTADCYSGDEYCEELTTIAARTGLPIKPTLPKFIRDILDSTKEDGTTIINI